MNGAWLGSGIMNSSLNTCFLLSSFIIFTKAKWRSIHFLVKLYFCERNLNEACLKSIALVCGLICHQFRRIWKSLFFYWDLKTEPGTDIWVKAEKAVNLAGLRKLEHAWTCLGAHNACAETAEDCNMIYNVLCFSHSALQPNPQ